MGLKMPKGVLFDLDGTLLDSAPDFIVSLDNLLERYNQPKLDPEIIRSHVSDGSWKLTSLGFNIDISDDKCAVFSQRGVVKLADRWAVFYFIWPQLCLCLAVVFNYHSDHEF